MSVINLITVAEADAYNASSSVWLALTDSVKEAHIFNSSLYMQSYWTCTDIDWEDTTTMTDDTKRACAYYAEADRLGLLFDPLEALESQHGRLTEKTQKVGSLLETTKWSSYGPLRTGNPLEMIDALMMGECTRLTGSVELTRV